MNGERQYLAYMVRLWTVHRNGDVVWRASAEDVHTGERAVFADVDSLCRYLIVQTTGGCNPAQGESHGTRSDKAPSAAA